jgi:hypothetical protein
MLTLEISQNLVQAREEDGCRFWLGTTEPYMTANWVPPSAEREFTIQRYQNGFANVCIYGEVVVLPFIGEACICCCPAFMPTLAQHPSDADWNVVVQEEAHPCALIRTLPRVAGPPQCQPESARDTPQ